jgi:hypothetical protein
MFKDHFVTESKLLKLIIVVPIHLLSQTQTPLVVKQRRQIPDSVTSYVRSFPYQQNSKSCVRATASNKQKLNWSISPSPSRFCKPKLNGTKLLLQDAGEDCKMRNFIIVHFTKY